MERARNQHLYCCLLSTTQCKVMDYNAAKSCQGSSAVARSAPVVRTTCGRARNGPTSFREAHRQESPVWTYPDASATAYQHGLWRGLHAKVLGGVFSKPVGTRGVSAEGHVLSRRVARRAIFRDGKADCSRRGCQRPVRNGVGLGSRGVDDVFPRTQDAKAVMWTSQTVAWPSRPPDHLRCTRTSQGVAALS